MLINGVKLPYVDVSYEFARNPSHFSHGVSPKYRGGVRLRNRRLESGVIPIPVVISRRDTNKTWEEITEELTTILYREQPHKISFSHGNGRYYLAEVI